MKEKTKSASKPFNVILFQVINHKNILFAKKNENFPIHLICSTFKTNIIYKTTLSKKLFVCVIIIA